MRILTGVAAAAAAGAIVFGIRIAPAGVRPFDAGDVLKVLAVLAIISLFVERTIEVTIGAWRGKTAEKLHSNAENARLALVSDPANIMLHANVAAVEDRLVDYRGETKKAALRAAVVLGLLAAAAGVRTLEALVLLPAQGQAAGLFRILDLIITGAAIGGGSEPIHKMMALVSTYMDAATGTVRARAAENARSLQVPVVRIPPLTPGPPIY